jgi:hypothetical protein
LNELGIIFRIAVSLTLFISGLSKLIHIKESIHYFRDWGLFLPAIGSVLGVLIPPIEILTGIALIKTNNLLIEIFAISIVFFLILINMKAVLDNDNKLCFCFGNVLKTRLGIGGLVHTIYLLIALFISIFIIKTEVANILYTCSLTSQILIVAVSILIFVNGLSIRLVLDNLASS